MSNGILCPILIIIFSILIIYGILHIRNNNLLKKNIENFIEKFESKSNNVNGNDLNVETVNEILNGKWTTKQTVADDNCALTNLMEIKSKSSSNEDQSGNNNRTYGTIILNNETFEITYVSLESLTARSKKNSSITLNIKFNIQLANEINKEKVNQPFFNPDQYNGVLGIYIDSNLVTKYAIYKVKDEIANSDLCRIIKSTDILVEQPPQMYDFQTYNILVKSYKYASNYININDWTVNNDILNIIKNKYFGNIQFSIQRIFYSPTSKDAEIITPASPPIILNCIKDDQIPNNLIIAPISQDQKANDLTSFFQPKGTRLLFYKLNDIKPTYKFGNSDNLIKPATLLKLQNNANGLFGQNINFPDLNSVQLLNTNNYNASFVKSVSSDLSSQTIIKFSELFALL